MGVSRVHRSFDIDFLVVLLTHSCSLQLTFLLLDHLQNDLLLILKLLQLFLYVLLNVLKRLILLLLLTKRGLLPHDILHRSN